MKHDLTNCLFVLLGLHATAACTVPGVDDSSTDAVASDINVTDVTRDDAGISARDVVIEDVSAIDGTSLATQLRGLVLVRETPDPDYAHAHVSVAMYDRPSVDIAPERWFDLVDSANGCALYQAAFMGDFGICDPECSDEQWCMPDLSCEQTPQFSPSGRIQISGTTPAVTLSYDSWGYQTFVDFDGANAFATDAMIVATSEGGDTEAFQVQTHGVADLVLYNSDPLTIQNGQALDVTWQPVNQGDDIEILLTPFLHIFMHTFIRCNVDDVGAWTIPWSLLQHFPDDASCGHGECAARSSIARYSEAYTSVADGYIKLRVESRLGINTYKP